MIIDKTNKIEKSDVLSFSVLNQKGTIYGIAFDDKKYIGHYIAGNNLILETSSIVDGKIVKSSRVFNLDRVDNYEIIYKQKKYNLDEKK